MSGAACGEEHLLEYIGRKGPTCTEPGNIAYWRCTDCGLCFLDADAVTAAGDTVLPALGHAYAVTGVTATCLADGEEILTCVRCGDEKREHADASGHLFGAFSTTKRATCTSEGEQKRSCVLCGKTETRTLPKTEHLFRDNTCSLCGLTVHGTEGLTYSVVIERGQTVGYRLVSAPAGETDVVIPNSYLGLPVVAIGAGAFAESPAERIAIYADLEEIGENAFSRCRALAEICFPSSLERIGKDAFRDCSSLSELDLPDGVLSVGEGAFYGCSGLKKLSVGAGLSEVGESAFWNCHRLETISVSEKNAFFSGEGNCLTRLPGELLLGCAATVVPGTVTEIGDYAFFGVEGLRSLTLPHGIVRIGAAAFRDCVGLSELIYRGTAAEWALIEKGDEWNFRTNFSEVTFLT